MSKWFTRRKKNICKEITKKKTNFKYIMASKSDDLDIDIREVTVQNKSRQTYKWIKDDHPVKQYINSSQNLFDLNKTRKRNVVLFDNKSHEVTYDLYDNKAFLRPKIAFSDFEYDSNRKFTEKVILSFMYDFPKIKSHYIKLLNHDRKLYSQQLDFIKGNKTPSKEELLVLISLLGRLEQQNIMGPIVTFRKEKLHPKLIVNHATNLKYIEETIYTVASSSQLLSNSESLLLKVPNADFNVIKPTNKELGFQSGLFIETLNSSRLPSIPQKISTGKIKGSVTSPNYLESFFRKMANLDRFESVLPFYNSDEDMSDLISYSKRFQGTPKQQDFMVAYKMRGILSTQQPAEIIKSIKEVYKTSKKNTYSLEVAQHLISKDYFIIEELFNLFFVFYNHIETEKQKYKENINELGESEFNDKYLAISSDMHFNSLTKYEKSNYSKDFNIIVGDFADNLFHRGNMLIEDKFEAVGIGVLGNHDIYLNQQATKDLKIEIENGYKISIEQLKETFPNIDILNDEILFKDGYAIVGMTLVYDEHQGVRKFFANEYWGSLFADDDYITRARYLLDKVPSDTPIIFVSHAPFKEYAVCSNKEIGVPSNHIFKDYPNVKMYIHGHGHSNSNSKYIEGVLCITNPLINNRKISEVSFDKEELFEILGLNNKFYDMKLLDEFIIDE